MRESPLQYIWQGDELVGLVLANANASGASPDKTEREIVRIFHEWGELGDENITLKAENAKLKKQIDEMSNAIDDLKDEITVMVNEG